MASEELFEFVYDSQSFTLAYTFHPHSINSSTDPARLLVFSHPFNNSREYWQPQINDPLLAEYNKITLDAIGFARSKTYPLPWSFDLAAYSILALLDHLDTPCVLVGDSMGGGPTGLRCALLDAGRIAAGNTSRILGVVACGTSAEEESSDFVAEYTIAAREFSRQCLAEGTDKAISTLAYNMARSGYGEKSEHVEWGAGVIRRSLTLSLGEEPQRAGEIMMAAYNTLDYRPSLIEALSVRPSSLRCPILVVHGTEDAAYPFERLYHERTVEAIGKEWAELYVVQKGSHFVTVTHAQEVDTKIVEWITRLDLFAVSS